MEETVKDRLLKFIEYLGLSKNRFEEICGLSKRYVSNISVSIQPDKVKKISLKFPELNTGWLLTGEGRMLNGPYERINQILAKEGISQKEFAKGTGGVMSFLFPSIYENAQKNPGDPVVLKQWVDSLLKRYPQYSEEWVMTGEGGMLKESGRKKIPLYDVESIGGHNDMVADTDTPAGHVAEWIDAGDWFPGATAAIRHYGDSMIEYPSGSILALKRVEDTSLLINGRNYVIETSEFRITKQLQVDGDYIMAYSSNRETYPDGRQIHAPIRIPKASIRHIDLVLGCVLKEYSNGPIPIIRK